MRLLKNVGRRALRNACALALRARSRPLALPPGRVLILAPHADDEALGCGALLAARHSAGLRTGVAYFTDGSASARGVPGLAVRRESEARAAMALVGLGHADLRFLGAPDGRLKHLSAAERDQWSARLGELFADLRPEALLLPGRADGSSEHEAMFALVAAALARAPARPRVLEFPVWSWWNPRFLWPQVQRADRVWRHDARPQLGRKAALLHSYTSQLEAAPGGTPTLAPGFLSAFLGPDEFFLETPLP